MLNYIIKEEYYIPLEDSKIQIVLASALINLSGVIIKNEGIKIQLSSSNPFEDDTNGRGFTKVETVPNSAEYIEINQGFKAVIYPPPGSE